MVPDITDRIETSNIRFQTSDDVFPLLKKACQKNPDLAHFHELGQSEEGRVIAGVVLGKGANRISLLAGAHSDEPTGPETLRAFILQSLARKDEFADLFSNFKFVVIPHVNPDGEAKNQPWIKKWPDIEAYLQHAYRELPGRDVEFGYPEMRPENRLVANFLKRYAPFRLHMSLHSMSFAEGGLLLIEKHWIARTPRLRSKFATRVLDAGLRLHDHDRQGEKGFRYIGPGFTTTPEGQAMRIFFKSKGDEQTAASFHDGSMEFVRSLGGDPLCLVTEIPLFCIDRQESGKQQGVPQAFLKFKASLPDLRARAMRGEAVSESIKAFQIKPVNLALQIRLQLAALQAGLDCVAGD
ncbi:MAG: M14 family zinc carboxypeptidase [bacterium]